MTTRPENVLYCFQCMLFNIQYVPRHQVKQTASVTVRAELQPAW